MLYGMNLQLEMSAQEISGWVVFLSIALLIWWLYVLVNLLKREDLKATDKICWTIVVVFLHIIGLLLYIFFAPKKPREIKRLEKTPHKGFTAAHLARRANQGRS